MTTIFVGSRFGSHAVQAYDTTNGTEVWSWTPPAGDLREVRYNSALGYVQALEPGYIYDLDPATGARVNTNSITDVRNFWTHPSGDNIVFDSGASSLERTGHVSGIAWEFVNGTGVGEVLVNHNGDVFFRDSNYFLVKLDGDTGSQEWFVSTGNINSQAASGNYAYAFHGWDQFELVCYEESTGNVVGSWDALDGGTYVEAYSGTYPYSITADANGSIYLALSQYNSDYSSVNTFKKISGLSSGSPVVDWSISTTSGSRLAAYLPTGDVFLSESSDDWWIVDSADGTTLSGPFTHPTEDVRRFAELGGMYSTFPSNYPTTASFPAAPTGLTLTEL